MYEKILRQAMIHSPLLLPASLAKDTAATRLVATVDHCARQEYMQAAKISNCSEFSSAERMLPLL